MANLPAMQAELGRLIILYFMGGVWVDLKLSARTSFLDDLRAPGVDPAEHFPTQDFPDPAAYRLLINSFIVADPENELIFRALQIAVGNVLTLNSEGGVWQLTGPRALMRAYDEYLFNQRRADFTIRILRHEECWNRLFSIGSGDYGGKHWSQRETEEELYSLE